MNRDAILIFLGLLLAVIFGALLLNYGSKNVSAPPTPAAVSFSVLAEGEQAGEVTRRVNYRIRTEEQFAALWEMLYANEEFPFPVVDFDAHDVLAVFEGERPSGGYDISIVSVMDNGNGEITVTILHEEPGATCLTTSVITTPFELVVVPKTEAKINREDLSEVKECE